MGRETLELVDWRRRVAALYLAEPRAGKAGAEAWRHGRDELFRDHPQSPLPAETRAAFGGLRYWPWDPDARVTAALEPAEEGADDELDRELDQELEIDTGGEDGVARYRRVGRLATPWGGLTLFWLTGYGGGLFLPFRDATSGHGSYGGGRYLADTIKGTFGRGLVDAGDGTIGLDLNYAYNPSCAYDARWACPLAPPENWLDGEVAAGEMAFGSSP